MLKYYLKHALRGILKNKLFSAFNIIGFAVGFAVCIIIALFVYREYSVDSHFPDADRVYRLIDVKSNSTKIDQDVVPFLLENYPEICCATPVYYLPMDDLSTFIKQEKSRNTVYVKEFMATNNDFFRLAGLRSIVAKSSTPFFDTKSIVLSETTALKLFGRIDIIDEEIDLYGIKMSVSAIVEDIPSNSSMSEDFYVHANNEAFPVGTHNTPKGVYYPKDIYIKLNEGADLASLVKKLNSAFPANMSETKEVAFQPVKDIYFSLPYAGSENRVGNRSLILIIITIALLTLIMSVFNYVSFTISKQLKTLKDAGVRITNGADSSQLKTYYIIDIGLSVLISFLLALLISKASVSFAAQLLDTPLSFSWLLKPELVLFVFILLTLVIAISAIVPVGFISRVNPQVLFGRFSLRHRKYSLQSFMTVFQLAVSIILFSAFFVVNKQLDFVKSADVGFNKEHLLRIDLPYPFDKHHVLKQQLRQYSFIQSMAYTSHAPGASWQTIDELSESGSNITLRAINIDKDFLSTFGIELLKGRKIFDGEINSACYISEKAFKDYEWKDIVGKTFNGLNVVGVVNDINVNSLHTGVVPVAFQFTNHYYNALNLRLMPGNVSEHIEQLKKIWNRVAPDSPFSYGFYDEFFSSLYIKEDRQAKALTVFCVIALIITCFGLLGQILQRAERKVKEIGIRKINGATNSEIMRMLNFEFVVSGFVAALVAIPTAWLLMDKWLQEFAYKTALNWWIFVLASLFTFVIAIITIGWQSWRAASCNPIETLRYE